jgi:hypothetical protein
MCARIWGRVIDSGLRLEDRSYYLNLHTITPYNEIGIAALSLFMSAWHTSYIALSFIGAPALCQFDISGWRPILAGWVVGGITGAFMKGLFDIYTRCEVPRYIAMYVEGREIGRSVTIESSPPPEPRTIYYEYSKLLPKLIPFGTHLCIHFGIVA